MKTPLEFFSISVGALVLHLEAQRSYLTLNATAEHRSHYSNNEIIMNAAARLHQRNIYCIIYSVPWFRENTYKLLATLFPLHKHTHTHTDADVRLVCLLKRCLVLAGFLGASQGLRMLRLNMRLEMQERLLAALSEDLPEFALAAVLDDSVFFLRRLLPPWILYHLEILWVLNTSSKVKTTGESRSAFESIQ